MQCVREPDNVYHSNAIKVQSNGVTVGRMPRKCSEIVAAYFDNNEIIHSIAFCKGRMAHGGSEDFGLGPKLICTYFFEFKNFQKRKEAMAKFLGVLKSCKEMKLK